MESRVAETRDSTAKSGGSQSGNPVRRVLV